MSIAQFFPFSKEVVWDFICQGPRSAVVKDLIFSEHPYRVIPNHLPKSWTKKNLEELSSLIKKSNLADRVESLQGRQSCFLVDKYLLVFGQNAVLRKQALKVWMPLERFFLRTTILNGSITASMLLLSFQNIPGYLAIASTLAAIAFCFFTGYGGARYLLARDEVAHWSNPSYHLALERTAAKETDFVDLWLNKPKFLNPRGGLLPIEIHGHYVDYFKHFAQSFLDRKCTTLEEQYAWLFDFFKIQPHPLDYGLMRELFGMEGYFHFLALGDKFSELRQNELVVRYDIKRVVKAIAELKTKEPARIKEMEDYEKHLIDSIQEHYQQEAEKLKKAVLQESAYLATLYQASQKLLKIAHDKIMESKNVIVADVKIDPQPAVFKISRDFYSNPKFPADPAKKDAYLAFLNELQIHKIETAPV